MGGVGQPPPAGQQPPPQDRLAKGCIYVCDPDFVAVRCPKCNTRQNMRVSVRTRSVECARQGCNEVISVGSNVQDGERPVLLMSDQAVVSGTTLVGRTVLAMPLSSETKYRSFGLAVAVPRSAPNGLAVDSWALPWQLRVIPTPSLARRMGRSETEMLTKIGDTIKLIMGLQ